MQTLEQQTETEFKAFCKTYGLEDLEKYLLDFSEFGLTTEFVNCPFYLSMRTTNRLVIGLNQTDNKKLLEPSFLKLVVAHEIAHVLRSLAQTKETRIQKEVRAWKKAFQILDLEENLEALRFAQASLETYALDSETLAEEKYTPQQLRINLKWLIKARAVEQSSAKAIFERAEQNAQKELDKEVK